MKLSDRLIPSGASRRHSLAALALWAGLAGCASSQNASLASDDVETDYLLTSSTTFSPIPASGLCLEPENGKIQNGTRLVVSACDGSPAQRWGNTKTNGAIVLGGSMCIDVVDGRNRDGTELQLWRCYQENTNQKFDVQGTSIRWRNTDKCFDLANGRTNDGTRLQIVTCRDASATQQWTSSSQSTGTIGAGNDGKAASKVGATGATAVNNAPVDFGSNVLIFDSGMSMSSIQSKMNGIYARQMPNHFGPERYAYLFKPGTYNLDVKVGFGMTVAGLGASPDDVTINGSVRVKAEFLPNNNATQNFWRSVENFSVVPTQDNGAMVFAVSQGTSMRRVHVRGNLNLSDNGWSSGGFLGDTKVDGTIDSGTQQQFLSRNDAYARWQGRNWNMVFVGTNGAPSGTWPDTPYSVVGSTPVIREKPYLAINNDGSYVVRYPQLKRGSSGISWGDNAAQDVVLPINTFYIARNNVDSADSINDALSRGLHVIFTPGLYNLNKSLQVTYPNTILMGMGIATLRAAQGTAVVTVADVDGVSISGIVVDAGPNNSPTLLQLGNDGANKDHSSNPTVLHDVSCRVGGAGDARTNSCLVVNSRDVILDNTWLWRADHGGGAGWWSNPSANGIIVNGSNVTAYGLFSEHFQAYQTLWNGENGATYMYQSEFPYDPPNQGAWQHDGVNGYASYKVADHVSKHMALGMGMYCIFNNSVRVENAVESPQVPGVTPNHIITVWLGVAGDSAITHIINGWGPAATPSSREQRTPW